MPSDRRLREDEPTPTNAPSKPGHSWVELPSALWWSVAVLVQAHEEGKRGHIEVHFPGDGRRPEVKEYVSRPEPSGQMTFGEKK